MQSMETLSALAIKSSALVHETQKERGMSALFLGSKGAKFGAELQAQRAKTDAALLAWKQQATQNSSAFGSAFKTDLTHAGDQLDPLSAKRQAISALQIAGRMPSPTTLRQRRAAGPCGNDGTMSRDGDITARIAAYVSFLQAKERAGIERAVLSNSFAQGKFGEGMFLKFGAVVAEQNAYLHSFLSLCSPNNRSFLQSRCKVRDHGDRADAPACLTADHKALQSVKADDWFRNQTEKINRLKAVEDRQSETLSHHEAPEGVGTGRPPLAFTLTLLTLLVSLGCAFLITRSLARPLAQMAQAAAGIAQGEIQQEVTYRSRDEIGALAQAFRDMIAYNKQMATIAGAIAGGISAGLSRPSRNRMRLERLLRP